ncbi:zinc-binding alcohol dehydrogenase family protein [Microbispora sp. NPDC049125]|uniref:quinone oxidoreductase family protein n=1 Tax=Microbispora sp. NPDC049125 TaxID=3154929 RepID=UPI003466E737
MRAIVLRETGGPEVLRLEEVPPPVPGPGEVLVRTEAVGVSYYETPLRAGVFPFPAPLPAVFGFEAAGTVTEVGEGADAALLGRRVTVMKLGGTGGTYAEYVAAGADALTLVPAGVSAADAVATAVQGAVALTLLRAAALEDGQTVLIEVAGGGVGGYLTQLVRGFGAGRVLATAGSEVKRRRARDLGADLVLDHTDPSWPDQVREAGGTVDVVFEAIGGASARRLLDAMTPGGGRMMFYGLLDGPPEVTPVDLLHRGLTLAGCGGLAAWGRHVQDARAEVLDMVADGRLRPQVDSVLPLADAATAHRRIEERAAIGKIVLVP